MKKNTKWNFASAYVFIIIFVFLAVLISVGLFYRNKLAFRQQLIADLKGAKLNILARDQFYRLIATQFAAEVLNQGLTPEQIYGRIKDLKHYLLTTNFGDLDANVSVAIRGKLITHMGISNSIQTRDYALTHYVDVTRDLYEASYNITSATGTVIGRVIIQQPLQKLAYALKSLYSTPSMTNYEILVGSVDGISENTPYNKVNLGGQEIVFYLNNFHAPAVIYSMWSILALGLCGGVIGTFLLRKISNESASRIALAEENAAAVCVQRKMEQTKSKFLNAFLFSVEKRVNYFDSLSKPLDIRHLSSLELSHVEGVASYFYEAIESKCIILKYKIDNELFGALCDVLLVQRLLLWQLDEIIKNIQRGGVIDIEFKKGKDIMKILISDNRFHFPTEADADKSEIEQKNLKDLSGDLSVTNDIGNFDIVKTKQGMQGSEIIITTSVLNAFKAVDNVIDINILRDIKK